MVPSMSGSRHRAGKLSGTHSCPCAGEVRFLWSLPLALFACLLTAAGAGASGLETSGIGARGRSMGYALAALADDWSALYYNPAGLARLETGQRACVYEFFTGGTSSTGNFVKKRGVVPDIEAARGVGGVALSH